MTKEQLWRQLNDLANYRQKLWKRWSGELLFSDEEREDWRTTMLRIERKLVELWLCYRLLRNGEPLWPPHQLKELVRRIWLGID